MNFDAGENKDCINSFSQILNKLYDLEDSGKYQLNGSFDLWLDNSQESNLPSWIPVINECSPSRLIVFGKDKLGGLFCFWFVDNKFIENAPIVYVGQDMEDCDVLAINLREFYEERLSGEKIGNFNNYVFEKTNLILKKMNTRFRKWVKGNNLLINTKRNIRTSE